MLENMSKNGVSEMVSRTIVHTWNVREFRGGHCIVWRSDGLIKPQPVLRHKLRQRMTAYGVVADSYDDLCGQLDRSGTATVIATDLTLLNSPNL